MHRTRHTDRRQLFLTMFAVALLVLLQVQLLPRFSVNDPSTADDDNATISALYASLPLAFEPNLGQVDGGAQFLVHHGKAITYFDGENTTTTIGSDTITMTLSDASAQSFIGTNQLESKTNYFIGNDSSQWHADIPNYKQLLAKNVYPGIDLKYYGTNSHLEHDFVVNPGSDYKQIAFRFRGQKDALLDQHGNLILHTGDGDFILNAPTTYQTTSNSKHTIPSQFKLKDDEVTIALNTDYDHSLPLIIDPVLVYSSYLGGSGIEFGLSVNVDPSGNIYVTGSTDSSNFPTVSPFQASNGGGSNDAFITKMNPSGSALIYSTYLGGSGNDGGQKIVTDISGNAYVVGITASTNFPIASAYQSTYGGGAEDVFVTKVNTTGSTLTFSTYLGGSATDGDGDGPSITIDSASNVYVAGTTSSTNFPTASPYQATKSGTRDVFVTKFNSTGSGLVFSTYLGGTGQEAGARLALDSGNSIYITGQTTSTDFPTASPYQASNAGGTTDAFITKFNPTGSSLTYSTYLGGSTGLEVSYGIAVDTSGNAYIVGYTDSTNFPTVSPIQASNAGGTYDVFVTKLNSAGSTLTYSTYLGGSGDDTGLGITVNPAGNAYVTGYTTSSNFPTTSAYDSSYNGLEDAYIAKLSPAGSALVYSTYLGGSAQEYGFDIALGLNGNAYITGFTSSTNLPTANPFQVSLNGSYDAYVAELSENSVVVTGTIAPTLTFTLGTTTCSMGTFSVSQTQYCTHSISASTNAQSGYVISYIPTTTLTSGAFTINAMASQSASTTGIEQFGMNLKANTAAGSNTAANFGADPSGGIGTAMTGYQTANLFKFATGGANIAQATGASATTTYTVSFIANIAVTTEAGTYSTPVTYNIIATY